MSTGQNDFVYMNIMAIVIILLLDNAVSKIQELKISKENYEKNKEEFLATQNNEI